MLRAHDSKSWAGDRAEAPGFRGRLMTKVDERWVPYPRATIVLRPVRVISSLKSRNKIWLCSMSADK